MRLALEILRAQSSLHFTALSILNRIVDICILHKSHHPWMLQHSSNASFQPAQSSTSGDTCTQFNSPHTQQVNDYNSNSLQELQVPPQQSGNHVLKKQDSVVSNSSVQHQVERIMNHSQLGSPRLSARRSFRTLLHQDSMRSFKSINSHMSQEPSVTSVKEPSFTEHSAYTSTSGVHNNPSISNATSRHSVNISHIVESQKTPIDYLTTVDPSLILETLQKAISMHKQTMGTRHKCKPSSRWKNCTYHCVQVLSARFLTVMCHSNVVQYRVVNEGYTKILVDALDPNHDPVSNLSFLYFCVTWIDSFFQCVCEYVYMSFPYQTRI